MRVSIDRRVLIIAASALGMIGYAYLTPPAGGAGLITSFKFFDDLSPEKAIYIQRFACSFLLLGVFPLVVARLSGYKVAELGVRHSGLKPWPVWYLAIILSGLAFGFISSFDGSLAAYYPYDQSLRADVAGGNVAPFLIHGSSYLILYYLPWEILFRGILILPFISSLRESDDITKAEGVRVKNSQSDNSKLLAIASMQAIPSALLHFGHPVAETISAVIFGIAAGYVVIRTRSVFPVVAFHASVGIGLDAAIVFIGR